MIESSCIACRLQRSPHSPQTGGSQTQVRRRTSVPPSPPGIVAATARLSIQGADGRTYEDSTHRLFRQSFARRRARQRAVDPAR